MRKEKIYLIEQTETQNRKLKKRNILKHKLTIPGYELNQIILPKDVLEGYSKNIPDNIGKIF